MPTHIDVIKTYKLFINGAFPRSESGRTLPVVGRQGATIAHVAHGSRKDFRDAVEAATKAQPGWADRTAYNRGQILYRMAEMLESRRTELAEAINATRPHGKPAATASSASPASRKKAGRRAANARTRRSAKQEVNASIERMVTFAGWADKFAQVLGCQNPVAAPYYTFTVPEPVGTVVTMPPTSPALLGLVSMLMPVIVTGNTTVVIVGGRDLLPAATFGELLATSDVPPGVVNILTTVPEELTEHIASHREVQAIFAANTSSSVRRGLELGAAENLKRVRVIGRDDEAWYDHDICDSPEELEPFVEMKTIWHPSAM